MAETTPTIDEKTETIPDNNAPNEENTEPAETATKKRGRPKGAADKAPRKKKITVVEEPVAQAEPEPKPVAEPPPEAKSKPKKAEKVQAPVDTPAPAPEEPAPSPRTMMREAARHILQLQTLREATRKSHLTDTYTKKLHSL